MSRASLLRFVAENALATDRPLAKDLQEAIKAFRMPTAKEREAIAAARAGEIDLALELLGFAPAAIVAARINPRQALAVGGRLRAIEPKTDLIATATHALVLPSIVLTVQAMVLLMMNLYILPVFRHMARLNRKTLPAPAQFLADIAHYAIPLVVAAFVFAFVVRTISTILRFWRPSWFPWQWEGACICSAAIPLIEAGGRAQDVLPQLLKTTWRRRALESSLSAESLDPMTLDVLSAKLVMDADRRLKRIGLVLEHGLFVLACIPAMVIAVTFYDLLADVMRLGGG